MFHATAFQSSFKYAWQQAVLDALREYDPERLLNKIMDAESAVSARLVQNPADPDERLALRGAVIALEYARNATVGKF
jgi:hypothetical protein